MSKSDCLRNHFLIAMPSMKDSNFARSVVIVCDHDEEGAMGLIINKPLQINLSNLMQHLDINIADAQTENYPVMMGGPVGQEQGFVIHNDSPLDVKDAGPDHCFDVSSSKDTLADIAKGKGPDHFIVTLGYSGWQPGQLEHEIGRNDWLIAPLDYKTLFTTPIKQRWAAAAQLVGVDIYQMPDKTGHA